MTTPILQPFSVEPGLNAPKLTTKQVIQWTILFENIQKLPTTLDGFGIKDAVKKSWADDKFAQYDWYFTNINQEITNIKNSISSINTDITNIKNTLANFEQRIAALEAK